MYVALGDSISIDDYAGGAGRGGASLLFRNRDDDFPHWRGRDVASRHPDAHFHLLGYCHERERLKLPASGALIQQVYPGSPAAQAGLRGSAQTQGGSQETRSGGDIITAVDGQPLAQGSDLPRAVIGKRIGDTLRLTVQRDGQAREVAVQLQAFSLPQAQQ